jgi:hypothetical protein
MDNALLHSPKQEYIDEVFENVQNSEMNLEVENNVAEFFGVHINKHDDGTIHMTQTGLIQRVVKAVCWSRKLQSDVATSTKVNAMHCSWLCARFHSFASPRRFVPESEWLILLHDFSKPWFMKITRQ